MGIVTFNGVSSKDLNIQVETPPGYKTPKKDYDTYHVPGKNGDVVIYKNSYQNVTREYKISIGDLNRDFTNMANTISEWLYASSGYARLEDSYEPEYYRLAIYTDETNVNNILQHGGKATIKFDCKPQRFLKSGEKPIIITDNTVIKNPTKFASLPIIKVKGNGESDGTVRIGNYYLTIKSTTSVITIDSELQDCYDGIINMNSYVTLLGNKEFPKIEPGDNELSFTGGIEKMEVIPRWWTI